LQEQRISRVLLFSTVPAQPTAGATAPHGVPARTQQPTPYHNHGARRPPPTQPADPSSHASCTSFLHASCATAGQLGPSPSLRSELTRRCHPCPSSRLISDSTLFVLAVSARSVSVRGARRPARRRTRSRGEFQPNEVHSTEITPLNSRKSSKIPFSGRPSANVR
jgi:hypothetical protein